MKLRMLRNWLNRWFMSLQHCNTMKLNFGLYHYKNAILVNTSINIYNIKGQMQTK
jgi:hypothetical protein